MTRAAKTAAVLVGVLMLAATACTSSSSTSAVKVDQPIAGGTFREALVTLGSEDPAKAQTVSERVVADELYDGLTRWNPDTLQAAPSLAQKWESSPDQKTWTFHLRTDALAGNSEPVTATDVKKSLEHVARRSAGAALTDQLSRVQGFAPFTNDATVTSLSGVTTIDDHTVQIQLDSPFAEFASLLGNPAMAVAHYLADGTTSTTGPFQIAERSTGKWQLKKSPSSTALVDGIEASFFADVSATYDAMNAQTVDWAPIPPDKADEAGRKYGTQLFKPSLRTLSLSFNLTSPKFADLRFRQAIVQAVDRVAVATKIDVDASVLNGVIPPNIPGDTGGNCGSACFHNVDSAKSLVGEVFPAGAPPIAIDVAAASPFTDAAAKELTDDLAAVGVTATVRTTPAAQYGAITVQTTRELFQTSWSAAYPGPGAFLDPLYRSTSASNVSGLKNADVDASLAAAFTAPLAVDQLSQFKEAESRVMAQMPVVPVAAFPVDSVQQARVRGVAVLPTGNFDAATVWLADGAATTTTSTR